jgi:hypothetical protein
MASDRAVFFEDHEVVPILQQMELDRDLLIDVVRYADSQRALCTSNDVRGFDLITVYDKAARGLREMFGGERWERDEAGNQAGIRNPHLKIRVIPCNFDEHAGDPDVLPTNRVPKGEASRSKTTLNRTGWIPGLPIPEPSLSPDDYTTWVLGIYAEGDMPVGAELSRPLNFFNGQYSMFLPRIILMWGPGGPGAGVRKRPDDTGPIEEVDIAINRR